MGITLWAAVDGVGVDPVGGTGAAIGAALPGSSRTHPAEAGHDLLLERGLRRGVRDGKGDGAHDVGRFSEIGGPDREEPSTRGDGPEPGSSTSSLRDGEHRHMLLEMIDQEHIAGLHPPQRLLDAAVGGGSRSPATLHAATPVEQSAVLDDIAPLASGLVPQRVEGLAAGGEVRFESDDVGVGLVLGEAHRQQSVGLLCGVAAHEIGGDVVRGSEGTRESEAATGDEPRRVLERHEWRPQDDRMAVIIDAAPPCPTGQLRELGRSEEIVSVAGVFGEFLDHHGAGGHVDPECEGLGGEHHPDQPGDEAFLDRLLEGRDHAGMVRRHPGLEGGQPVVVLEDPQVLVGEVGDMVLGDLADAVALLGCGEREPHPHAGPDGVIACRPAEDEIESREHVSGGEQLDHPGAARGRPASLRTAATGVARYIALVAVEAMPIGIRLAVDEGLDHDELTGLAIIGEEPVVEGDGSSGLHDDIGGTAHRLDPGRQLRRVGHRGRQTHQSHRSRQMDDDLLPHGTPVGVLQVVHLVEDHPAETVESARSGVDHVAEHLGGHHHDRRIAVDRGVAGEETDPAGAVDLHEVVELLVGERLDRGGVERPGRRGERHLDGMLGDDRLARSGRSAHQHRASPVDRRDRLPLEIVEFEGSGLAAHTMRLGRHVRTRCRILTPQQRSDAGVGDAGRAGWRRPRRRGSTARASERRGRSSRSDRHSE